MPKTFNNLRPALEFHEYVISCIENDNHVELARLAHIAEDEEEAYHLRRQAAEAYQRAWGYEHAYDQANDNGDI